MKLMIKNYQMMYIKILSNILFNSFNENDNNIISHIELLTINEP